MAEEEVKMEVEAVVSVYGGDCVVLNTYPPHLHVKIKPRTADVSSQQFVEAIVGMKAGPQYPEEPPDISIIDSKGLDEQRQTNLLTCIRDKGPELASCLMLVALCEEAVEQLSNMNHPDGDCPLCLCPLVDEDGDNESLPFMKLMSCFHCFHCACIIRWWNWLQVQREKGSSSSASSSPRAQQQKQGTCPVCRKVFHAKDIEHVLDLVGTNSLLDSSITEGDDEANILHSESETIRRQKFEAIVKLQQENSGLIEPKNNKVLQPGMYVPCPVARPTDVLVEPQCKVESETNSRSFSDRPSSSWSRNTNMRKQKLLNAGKQQKQWIRKENNMRS